MSKTPHSISTTENSENLSRSNLNKPKHDRRYSYLMMIAHLCDDLNQGALVAVIPFLVLHNGYSYAEVTALLLASNAASAIIQPPSDGSATKSRVLGLWRQASSLQVSAWQEWEYCRTIR